MTREQFTKHATVIVFDESLTNAQMRAKMRALVDVADDRIFSQPYQSFAMRLRYTEWYRFYSERN